uniref:RE54143p n=1 Tax=Drosophila melanogaster TaxID=7227 RepID=Q7YU57_DROME|nr:RE54143p [Drosophila melanogaster]
MSRRTPPITTVATGYSVLIEAVSAYPLLYDSTCTGYQNTRHRFLIWSAISNEVHDKATKLMKCWLKLQTRYEWELIHRPRHIGTSELCRLMDFMEPHVQRMRGTVCKSSKYLQNGWHEPIENFHTVMALITTMRNMPELVQLTEDSLHNKVKPPRYDEFWQKVGMEVMCSHEHCEVTWLVLRAFYHELQAVRSSGYQLQDKWFFEGSMGLALTPVTSRSTARPALKRTANGAIPVAGEPPAKTPVPVRMPLAIVYPSTSKGSSTSMTNSASTATSIGPTFTNVRRSSGPVINNTSTAAAATNSVSSSVSPDQALPKFVIPKITSAISVGSGYMIPLKFVPNVRILPKPAATMGTGVSPIATTNQMAGPNAKPPEVRPQITQGPGLQVKLHTKPQMASRPQMAPVVPRTVIRTTNPTNPAQTQDRVSGGPMSTLGELLRPQNPSQIRSPAPQQTLPNFVPITTSNITAKSNLPTPTAAPMVRIHQPGLKSAWDGKSNSAPFSKPIRSLLTTSSPAAAPIVATAEPARAKIIPPKPKLPATTLVNPKKYQPIVPVAVLPTAATRMAKPATEPATELPVTTPPIATGQTTRVIRKTPLFPTSATQAASDSYATIQGTLASQAKAVGAAISAPVVRPAKLPTVAKATTASQSDIKATAAASATLGSQPENLPLGNITVCLHESDTTGNELQVWCGNQGTRFNLNMIRTTTLIREVMAVPQLHKEDPQLAAKCVEFWHFIAKKFHMPEEALRACWKFLAANMSVFPKIAPMSELMRPFKYSEKVWEKSNRLFGKFDEIALKYQWLNHKNVLPEVIRFFAKYEYLYCDLRRPRPGEDAQAPPQLTNQEKQEVWREARLKFPNLNHRDIWSMFKFAFRTYLDDLERGIDNPWPQNWWQALEQLRFLVNVRYHPLEPYYYIVHNRMSEEVKRCKMHEALTSSDHIDKTKFTPSKLLTGFSKEPKPWETEEAKRLLTGKLNSVRSTETLTQIAPAPALALAPDAQPIPVPDGVSVSKKTSESKPASNANVKSHKDKNISTAQKRPTPARSVTCNNLSPIEAFELCKKLRSQPNSFERASTLDKRAAWVRVSKELHATVTECRLGLSTLCARCAI